MLAVVFMLFVANWLPTLWLPPRLNEVLDRVAHGAWMQTEKADTGVNADLGTAIALLVVPITAMTAGSFAVFSWLYPFVERDNRELMYMGAVSQACVLTSPVATLLLMGAWIAAVVALTATACAFVPALGRAAWRFFSGSWTPVPADLSPDLDAEARVRSACMLVAGGCALIAVIAGSISAHAVACILQS